MATRYPLRILVAEDNVVNQKLIERMLARLGYQVDLVSNGIEVLDALGSRRYDVILMDVQMPEMGGIQATSRINELFDESQRPIIVALTAAVLEKDIREYRSVGMKHVISKPVRVETLVSVLESCSEPTTDSSSKEATRTDLESSSSDQPDAASLKKRLFNQIRSVIGEDDSGFFADVVAYFLKESRETVASIVQARDDECAEDLYLMAKKLRSSSAMMGADEFAEMCRTIAHRTSDGSTFEDPGFWSEFLEMYILVGVALESIIAKSSSGRSPGNLGPRSRTDRQAIKRKNPPRRTLKRANRGERRN